MTNKPVHVFSEIGKLETVILHRPGKELTNLIPDFLDRLLFDDIPYLKDAQAEHDAFADVLRQNGVEVLYLERLAAEAIDHGNVKEQFIDEWLAESGLTKDTNAYEAVRNHLLAYDDTYEMVLRTIEGYRKSELVVDSGSSLSDKVELDYPFLVDPMPNLYFTRDPFATMGHGVSLNHMYSDTRNRETLYGKYIFTYHERFGNGQTEFYYHREEDTRIEGGDELILSKDTLAVGISQRTDARSIEKLAKNLFAKTSYKRILAFLIANNRKFMHLDTVFTHVDYDKFTIHPEIEGDLKVYDIQMVDGKLQVKETIDSLENTLAEALGLQSITLIRCGDGDPVDAAREQWNDGSNTLTIAPGEVVVYDRNTVTNRLLKEAGIKVHEVRGAELVRGRGGPRCMSMPVRRKDI